MKQRQAASSVGTRTVLVVAHTGREAAVRRQHQLVPARVEDAHPVELAALEEELVEAAHLVRRRDHVRRRHDPGEETRVVGERGDLAETDAERPLQDRRQRREAR